MHCHALAMGSEARTVMVRSATRTCMTMLYGEPRRRASAYIVIPQVRSRVAWHYRPHIHIHPHTSENVALWLRFALLQ